MPVPQTVARALTELESCTLGVVHQHQPCSTYLVRAVFARSTTTRWSASAGSIYPLIARLLRSRHLRIANRPRDARGRRDLVLTKKGERALQSWVLNLEESTARATPDPIRTRAIFLDCLTSAKDRRDLLAHAETLTQVMIEELRAEEMALSATVDKADYLAALGARLQLEARLKWLGVVRRNQGLA